MNNGDIVPKTPPGFLGFKHFGTPMFYNLEPIDEWNIHADQDFDGSNLWGGGIELVNHLIPGDTGYLKRLMRGKKI